MQTMKDAVKQLQEELQQKDEQLAAFKAKTKAYVESKTKQHAQALEVFLRGVSLAHVRGTLRAGMRVTRSPCARAPGRAAEIRRSAS